MQADRNALFRQARAAIDRRDWTNARALAHRLLRQGRNDPTGLILLAEIEHETDHLDEELDWLLRAVKLQPKNPAFRDHLGRAYTFRGQYPRALAQFEKTTKLAPDSSAGTIGTAQVYQYQNRWDRARRLLERLVARGVPEPRVAQLHVRGLAHDGDLDEAIAVGSAVLAAGHPDSVELRGLCFELARAYERTGDHEAAFDTASRGNRMLAPPFDPETVVQHVDRLIETFTREQLDRLPRPATPSPLPVFVVGIPRCGSTLVERIIASHPAAHGAGEIRDMLHFVRTLPDRIDSTLPYPACVADLDANDVETVSAAYLADLARRAPRAERITNKDLANYQHLGLIEVLFPRGRVIHCRRDPLDTCLSCFMQAFAPNTSIFTNDLRHLGLYYRQYERLMDHYRTVVDLPRLDVDYETLIDDQEGTTRRIIEFCGLPWDDACLRFHEAKRQERTMSFDQARRPIYRSSLGRAARFGALLDPLREALGMSPFA